MSTTTPSPRTWTLRFKHNRTTVLVYVDPLQRWHSIRADLLRAIQQTNPTGTFYDQPIPSSPQNVLLARPVDPNDLSKGWISLGEENPASAAADEISGKGKGKAAAAAKPKTGKDSQKDCPQGAGLREGAILAFKFREDGITAGTEKSDEEGSAAANDEEWDTMDGDTVVGEATKGEKWDVIVPTLEETYDDEDLMHDDEGIGLEP